MGEEKRRLADQIERAIGERQGFLRRRGVADPLSEVLARTVRSFKRATEGVPLDRKLADEG